jgi:hypothetical protein
MFVAVLNEEWTERGETVVFADTKVIQVDGMSRDKRRKTSARMLQLI